jgi:hypothetical protein
MSRCATFGEAENFTMMGEMSPEAQSSSYLVFLAAMVLPTFENLSHALHFTLLSSETLAKSDQDMLEFQSKASPNHLSKGSYGLGSNSTLCFALFRCFMRVSDFGRSSWKIQGFFLPNRCVVVIAVFLQ